VPDKPAIRVAADIERQQGFTGNLTTGHNQDDTHTNGVRVSILAQPLESVRNLTILDYTQFDTNGLGQFPFQVLNPSANPQLAAAAAAIYALGEVETDFKRS
jgi:iron complex outermembrane receptor protein